MIIAKHTVTIFNKYAATGQPPFPPSEGWNRTVIKFAQWEDKTDRNMTTSGITHIDKHIRVFIPKNSDTGGKEFIPPSEWARLPNDQKLLFWTIQADDYIALGEAPEIDSSYPMATMRSQFRNCLVKTLNDLSNQPVLPHWEIAGI